MNNMKEELIHQWNSYKEFLDRLMYERKITETNHQTYQNFNDFMIWLEIGRLNNGIK